MADNLHQEEMRLYREWREKWAGLTGEEAVKPMDGIIPWFIENQPHVIIPESPSPVTAIFVQPDRTIRSPYESEPARNETNLLVLYNGDKDLAQITVAPKTSARLNDSALLRYAEACIALPHPEEAKIDDPELYRPRTVNKVLDVMNHAVMSKSVRGQGFWDNFNHQEIKRSLQYNSYPTGEGYTIPPRITLAPYEQGQAAEQLRKTMLLPPEATDELATALLPAYQKITYEAWDRFAGHLNTNVMQQFEKSGAEIDRKQYGYLSAQSQEGARHRGAVSQFPFLADYVGIKAGYDLPMPSVKTGKIVDLKPNIENDGENVINGLAQAAGVDRNVVKRFAGMPCERRMSLEKHHIDIGSTAYSHLIHAVGCIPDVNLVPFYNKDPEKFDALIQAVLACFAIDSSSIFHSISAERPGYPINLVAPPSPDIFPPAWLKELLKTMKSDMRPLAQKWANGHAEELADKVGGIRDYLEIVKEVIVLPEIARRLKLPAALKHEKIDYQAIMQDLGDTFLLGMMKGKDIGQVFALADKWHQREGALEDEIRVLPRQEKWEKLIPDTEVPLAVAPSGLTISALNSAQELKAEGREMDHCVGGYASQCIYQPQHVLSIRDRNGKRVSTLLLKEGARDHEHEFSIEQHYTRGNKKPLPEAVAAAAWLVKEIAARRIPVDLYATEKAREKARAADIDIKYQIGFDPHDEAHRKLAFNRYQDAGLLLKEKVAGPEAFFAATGLDKAIEGVEAAFRGGKYRRAADQPARAIG